jgi:predicted phosphodiesterase
LSTRLALFSDIHGNSVALDVVLADIQADGGVDAYWVLGDLVGGGPDPVGVLERLRALPNVCIVRGNTDRYVVSGVPNRMALDEICRDSHRAAAFVEMIESLAWTRGAVTSTNWLSWLDSLPVERRLVLPGGVRLLGVHASPDCDDGEGMHAGRSHAEMRSALARCEADVVCVGHTHVPMRITVDGVDVINVGSLSNPIPPDLRASYTILEVDRSDYRVLQRRVDYDREAVIAAAQRVRHPAAECIGRFMRGQEP